MLDNIDVGQKLEVVGITYAPERGTFRGPKSVPEWHGRNNIEVGDAVVARNVWPEQRSVNVIKKCAECRLGIYTHDDPDTGERVFRPGGGAEYCGVQHNDGCSAVLLFEDLKPISD